MFQVEIRELSSNGCRFCWACSFRKHPVNSKIYWNDLQSSSFTAPDERRAKRRLGIWGPISDVGAHHCIQRSGSICWNINEDKKAWKLFLAGFIMIYHQPTTNQPTNHWHSDIAWYFLYTLTMSHQAFPLNPGSFTTAHQLPWVAPSRLRTAAWHRFQQLRWGDQSRSCYWWSNDSCWLVKPILYITIYIYGNISVDIGSIYISFYHHFMSCSVHVLSCHVINGTIPGQSSSKPLVKGNSLFEFLTHSYPISFANLPAKKRIADLIAVEWSKHGNIIDIIDW